MSKRDKDALMMPAHILAGLKVDGKKQALQEIAKLAAAQTGVGEHVIFDALFAREKLGTTGVGHGIAIPHGKIENIDKVHGFFVRLDEAIDYEAIDEKPVDLLFTLLAPHDAGADHLKALAKISRMFRDPAFCQKLRKAADTKALYVLLSEGEREVDKAA